MRNFFKLGKVKEGEHALVLAPRRVILEQITNVGSDFRNMFKDLPIPIVHIGDYDMTKSERMISELRKPETRIIVATPQLVNTVLRRYGELEDFGRIKAVVLDEVHHTYNGSKISESIRRLIDGCEFVLGLSATPTRESVENIGEILFHYPTEKAMNENILVRRVKFYRFKTEVYDLPPRCEDAWKVAIRDRAEKYAEKMLEVIREEREENRQKRGLKTAVVCPNITEADILFDVLKEKVDDVYIVHYKISDHRDQLERFRRCNEGILVSVNMVDIGFDDRDLEALVLARPLRNPISYVQLKGRVLRKPIGEWNIKWNYAVIVDLVDNFERHEKLSKHATLGEIQAGEFESDLHGMREVPEVEAKVRVKRKGITVLGGDKHPIEKPEYPVIDVRENLSEGHYVEKICEYLRKYGGVVVRVRFGSLLYKGKRIIEHVEKKVKIVAEEWRRVNSGRHVERKVIRQR